MLGGCGVVWQLTSSWSTLVTALPANKLPYAICCCVFLSLQILDYLPLIFASLPPGSSSTIFLSHPPGSHHLTHPVWHLAVHIFSFWPPVSHQHCQSHSSTALLANKSFLSHSLPPSSLSSLSLSLFLVMPKQKSFTTELQ